MYGWESRKHGSTISILLGRKLKNREVKKPAKAPSLWKEASDFEHRTLGSH